MKGGGASTCCQDEGRPRERGEVLGTCRDAKEMPSVRWKYQARSAGESQRSRGCKRRVPAANFKAKAGPGAERLRCGLWKSVEKPKELTDLRTGPRVSGKVRT